MENSEWHLLAFLIAPRGAASTRVTSWEVPAATRGHLEIKRD